VHIPRLCSSFCRLLTWNHYPSLPHPNGGTNHLLSCAFPFFLLVHKSSGVRNHNEPELISVLPKQTSTILTKKFPTWSVSARAAYKLQDGVQYSPDYPTFGYLTFRFIRLAVSERSTISALSSTCGAVYHPPHLLHFMYAVALLFRRWRDLTISKSKEAQKQVHITDFLKK
jgi:hypothetical protein